MTKEEKLEEAKRLYKTANADQEYVLESLFPELAVNEDEKIRQFLIHEVTETSDEIMSYRNMNKKDVLAWLEKQAEQKPVTDFSDIKTWKYIVDAVWTEKEGIGQYLDSPFTEEVAKKLQKRFGKIEQEPQVKPAEKDHDVCDTCEEKASCVNPCPVKLVEQKPANNVEPKFHEGEWVVYKNDICQIVKREEGCNKLVTNFGIEKELVNERNLSTARLWTIQDAKDGDVLAAHECLVLFKEIDGLNIRCYCTYHYMNHQKFYVDTLQNKTAFCPATKEQRDKLEKAMANAGYEWDAEKKELKKIEQSPLDVRTTGYWHIENAEQNPAWSEEDGKMINKLLAVVNLYYDRSGNDLDKQSCISFLKSLKNRVQPKQEWSEEDEEMYKEVLTDIIYAKNDLKAKECHGLSKRAMEAFNWFSNRYKSLRPQSTWRPSEEQIKVCKEVYADLLSAKGFDLGTVNGELNRLEEELKKLK